MCHVAELVILPREHSLKTGGSSATLTKDAALALPTARPGSRPAESGLRAADAGSQAPASRAVELFTSLIIKTEGVFFLLPFPKVVRFGE